MNKLIDGPASRLFTPLRFDGGIPFSELSAEIVSTNMAQQASEAPKGSCVAWGIPFEVDRVLVIKEMAVQTSFEPVRASWLVFMHTADERPNNPNQHGFLSPMMGEGRLNEHAASYIFLYEDGTEELVQIRRRHQVNLFSRRWGENGFQCVAAHKPQPVRGAQEQLFPDWGWTQTRVNTQDDFRWTNWLWAWQNPHPEKPIKAIRFEPVSGAIIVSAISAGNVTEQPLRWNTRRKAIMKLGEGEVFKPDLDEQGSLVQIKLDMGQVISAKPRMMYPGDAWGESYNNQLPTRSGNELIIEYTAHPQACFSLEDGTTIPVADVETGSPDISDLLRPIAAAKQRITLRVVEKQSQKLTAVKLHIHGEGGEYLPPVDRHRIINGSWFEDYSVDYTHQDLHSCSYIPGETIVDLPVGKVYIEISKGFEIRPVRKTLVISPDTEEVTIEIERVLPWREKGWVTADTHVHFLSPGSALLEGAGEGVNVVNLLASQWGELMTNVGDFDGKTTWGEMDTGGGPESNGEFLVRVGTENRQHVLGHISLLGYQGRIIAPMTVGGPDEAALGDPIDILLTEWARQCKKQGGLVVLPHFPNPRAEHAASLVSGDIDAVEMTSWSNLYGGIDPYSLSDWYRYLNCGYLVPAVGGTDKMWAGVAVGTVRTYARIAQDKPFTYSTWMEAVRRAETFVSYGPLIEFAVEGKPSGTRIQLNANGGSVDITWQVASVTMPMTRVDLIVNGEIRESTMVHPSGDTGSWRLKVEKSSWVALLVRGHYGDQPEIISAHSSPVFIEVAGSEMLAAADAVTILEQIEGALAYLDTIGTRAEDIAYKRMRMEIISAHRKLHNRLHQAGTYHDHTPVMEHHQ